MPGGEGILPHFGRGLMFVLLGLLDSRKRRWGGQLTWGGRINTRAGAAFWGRGGGGGVRVATTQWQGEGERKNTTKKKEGSRRGLRVKRPSLGFTASLLFSAGGLEPPPPLESSTTFYFISICCLPSSSALFFPLRTSLFFLTMKWNLGAAREYFTHLKLCFRHAEFQTSPELLAKKKKNTESLFEHLFLPQQTGFPLWGIRILFTLFICFYIWCINQHLKMFLVCFQIVK